MKESHQGKLAIASIKRSNYNKQYSSKNDVKIMEIP